jgi:hypothetical protein
MKTLKITAVLGLLLLFFSQCEKDELLQNTPIGQAKSLNADDLDKEEKMIQLIRKLENPYTVEAMKHVQDTLIELGVINNPIEITTTHYYVRFLPKDEMAFEKLAERFEEENNELFDFPLDYEISDDGSYYQDPDLIGDSITWQYTVVPLNYSFSGVHYEKLANLFLYDETKEDTEIEEMIEDISLFLTNNWDSDDEPPTFQKSIKASKWIPSGTVLALDHQLGYNAPVEGAKVVMRRWFKWSNDYTDQNGYFKSTKKFKKKVQYKIKWATPVYKIRSGAWLLSPAWTVGPKQKGAWNATFTKNLRLFYATVHKGAHDFFYKDPFGLKKPNPWINRLKISALDKCRVSNAIHAGSIIGLSDIRVYRKSSSCSVRNTLGLYGLTIHELAHSNQRSHGVNKFIMCSKLVRESWAETVEWAFIMHKYYPGTLTDNSTQHNFLNSIFMSYSANSLRNYPSVNWTFNMGLQDYTSIFIDLIDCDVSNTFTTTGIQEDICSYSLWEIEQAISNKGWSSNVTANLNGIEKYLVDNYGNKGPLLTKYLDVYRNNY